MGIQILNRHQTGLFAEPDGYLYTYVSGVDHFARHPAINDKFSAGYEIILGVGEIEDSLCNVLWHADASCRVLGMIVFVQVFAR